MNFDARELRGVLGAFVTGVTVVTTLDAEGQPQGVTANSFSSVSLEPPLVLWSQATGARSHPLYREAERFVVNILALDQMELSQRFARSGPDKFAGVATRPGLAGLPLIDGACAHIECRKVAMLPGGDHVIFVGQVESIARTTCRPLVFGGGRYMVAFPHEAAERADPASASAAPHLEAVRVVGAATAELASRLGVMLGLGVWGNQGPTIVRWEPGPTPLAEDFRVGTVVSPIASATGLAFVAFLPEHVTREAVAAEIAARSSEASSQDRRASVAALIEAVRARGCAHSLPGQFKDDVVAISVPIRAAGGRMVFALTAVLPASAPSLGGALEAQLAAEAAAISRRLGA